MVKLKVTRVYDDTVFGRRMAIDELIETNEDRAKALSEAGVAQILEIIKPAPKTKATKKAKSKPRTKAKK
jgi:hypothetical protein